MVVIHRFDCIVNSIKDSGYYSIVEDESSDVSNVQQFVICIRWVDNLLEPMRTLLDFMQ